MKFIKNPSVFISVLGAYVAAILYPWVTGFMFLATLNFFILLIGFTYRQKDQRKHALLMTLGIVSDLAIVLTLQVQRNAVATAIAFKLSALNQAHIFCSTSATVLYFPMIYLGYQLIQKKSGPQTKTLHRKLGYATLILRGLGFFLMFSMLKL